MDVDTAEQLLKESILSDLDQAILLARNIDEKDNTTKLTKIAIIDILKGVERKIK